MKLNYKGRRSSGGVHDSISLQNLSTQQKLNKLKTQIQNQKKQHSGRSSLKSQTQKFLENIQNTNEERNKSPAIENQLFEILRQLKMEKYAKTLQQYGITTFEDLLRTKKITIDGMNDLPIGYRIKLKKYVKNGKSGHSNIRYSAVEECAENQQEKQLNIEQIMNKRNRERKFIPLQTSCFSLSNEFIEEQSNPSQQQRINTDNNTPLQMKDRQQIKTIEKKVQFGKVAYCWGCFKKILEIIVKKNSNPYCSQQCYEKYKKKMRIDQKMIEQNNSFLKNHKRKDLQREQFFTKIDLQII